MRGRLAADHCGPLVSLMMQIKRAIYEEGSHNVANRESSSRFEFEVRPQHVSVVTHSYCHSQLSANRVVQYGAVYYTPPPFTRMAMTDQ